MVEELTEKRHPAIEWRRNALVRGDVGNESEIYIGNLALSPVLECTVNDNSTIHALNQRTRLDRFALVFLNECINCQLVGKKCSNRGGVADVHRDDQV